MIIWDKYDNTYKDVIEVSVIKEKLLKPIQEEGQKVYEKFMSMSKEENFEIEGALLQELGAIEGMIIELLEDFEETGNHIPRKGED